MNAANFDEEPFLRKDVFLPHMLTVVNNAYAWHASRLYLDVIGLGLNETRIISILYEMGGLQAWEISEILNMNKATVSRGLRILEEARLIEMKKTRRGRQATPTAASAPIHRQIVRMARTREEILLRNFSLDEREQLLDFLNRLYANVPDCIALTAEHFQDHPTPPEK
jgi:DNA-binding MarR family transcriptional regulator